MTNKKSTRWCTAIFITFFCVLCNVIGLAQVSNGEKVWSIDKALKWSTAHGWLSGINYIPRTAVNQLEMWQEETFDTTTMNEELKWAEDLGFNTARVFLHHLTWKEDTMGFKQRIKMYLAVADRHHIKTIFVFFDDCWNKKATTGKQPELKLGVHNSQWVQDPGDPESTDPRVFPLLEKYVKDILVSFGTDERIVAWDLYNEPGNSGKGNTTLPLLQNVFKWANEIRPAQPVTSGIWAPALGDITRFQLAHSDIITFHSYKKPEEHLLIIQLLKALGRPVVCTEYMARTKTNRFSNILPMLKKERVGAISWGLVDGKTNTKYAWDTPVAGGAEPAEWFHDILHKDGRPYKIEEAQLIRKINLQHTN